MRDFTILQVGDLHFDDLLAAKPDTDSKDSGFPAGLLAAVSAHPLQAVMKPMAEQLDRADAMMVVGDLSSYGDLDVYGEAVTYLNKAFALPERNVEIVHAVVGNHDVDRTLIAPGDRGLADILAKFEPLREAWRDRSIPILEPAAVRTTEVVEGRIGLELFSMNSCVGCGEYRETVLNAAIEEELKERITAGDLSARDTLFEQLDSPGFLDEHLAEVTGRIRSLPPNRVPIVLAHHNVLPQFQPRLQIYAEMINAGAARARLAACDRPVIYLHGHIHDDPVEVIEQLRPHNGKLIAISAPQVQAGFNIIRVTFGQRDLPIGVTIEPWRYAYGEVREEASVCISLRRPNQENHDATEEILTVLASEPRARYSQFLKRYRDQFGVSRAEEDLQQGLVEGDWAGLVHVENVEEPAAQWIVSLPLI